MGSYNKIIDILGLLTTDQREETIRKYIEYTLFKNSTITSVEEIITWTDEEFQIALQKQEVADELQFLINSNRVIRNNSYFNLVPSTQEEIQSLIQENTKSFNEQFEIFKREIQNFNKGRIDDITLGKLFKAFEEYIYECFLEYGRSATEIFKDTGTTENNKNNNVFLTQILSKLKNQNHKKLLENYLQDFPNIITAKQLNFLEDLSDRCEYFFSLGLSKELHSELKNISPIDWTFFLDTNILYSILKIRSHKENEAILSLIDIVNSNPNLFSIKLKYLPITHRELKLLKSDLENDVKNVQLNKKQVEAALKSGKLDDFTKCYYESILQFGVNAKHPAAIIDNSILTLKSKQVELYNRESFKDVDINSEDFKDKISAYNQYQQIRNEARQERGFEARPFKNIEKIEHDVTLREAILSLRRTTNSESVNLSECKIYGLTIDKGLIDYDTYSLRKKFRSKAGVPPTFFFPSYLLKRLYRYLPVQSDNYRKSFISAISSPVFLNKGEDSRIAQSALIHFNSLGIDDPEFIINCLTSDIFLSELQNIETDEQKVTEFIESEINKTIAKKDTEIKSKEKQISQIKNKLDKKSEESEAVKSENNSLKEREEVLKLDQDTLYKGITKLQKQLKKINNPNPQGFIKQAIIPFEEAEKDRTIKILEQEIENRNKREEQRKEKLIKNYKIDELRKWQRAPIIWLIILLIITIGLGIVSLYLVNWDVNKLLSNYKALITGFFSLVGLIVNGILLKEITSRNTDFKNIEAYKNSIEVPEHVYL